MALAHLLGEDMAPAEELWEQSLVSSRLLGYEMWTRLDAMELRSSHGDLLGDVLSRVSTLELVGPVLARALTGFDVSLRTLDALHLASLLFLVEQGAEVELASYDQRLCAAAEAHGVQPYDL